MMPRSTMLHRNMPMSNVPYAVTASQMYSAVLLAEVAAAMELANYHSVQRSYTSSEKEKI
jgi:hypothetical protein